MTMYDKWPLNSTGKSYSGMSGGGSTPAENVTFPPGWSTSTSAGVAEEGFLTAGTRTLRGNV
eukprot:7735811-Prorocentrum_lima.AAC.1